MASRNIKDLHPELAESFLEALRIYQDRYPDAPQPFLTCTHRSNQEQEALHAQGRLEHEQINALRKKAGMMPISKTESKRRVTNARPGSSYHNQYPAMAFDIAFINSNKKLDWSVNLFRSFWLIIKDVDKNITWGGGWQSIKDYPHFQLDK